RTGAARARALTVGSMAARIASRANVDGAMFRTRLDPHFARGEQLAHFFEVRHAVEGAEPRAADRGGRVRGSQRLLDRLAVDQRVDEAAAEDIAGAGRVERVHAERRLVIEAIVLERHRAALAHGD